MAEKREPEILDEEETRNALKTADIRRIAKNIVDGFEEKNEKRNPTSRIGKIRKNARDIFHATMNPVLQVLGIPGALDRVKHVVSPTMPTNEDYERYRALYEELRDQGQLFSVRVDGKIVSAGGYCRRGEDPDTHRAVWEIVRVSTLKEYEGRKYGSRVMDASEQAILKRDPLAHVTIVSEDFAVKTWAENRGYDEIPLITLEELRNPGRIISPKECERLERVNLTAKAYRRRDS